MTILTLASKQTWPQILTVAQMRPDRLFLLHSDDAHESRTPARRLKRFFDKSGLVPKGGTRLERIPHDNFDAIEKRFDDLVATHQLNLNQCQLNFTGGNKLMATAAFRWAARRGVNAFYLERGNTLTSFKPRDGDLLTVTETIDGHITDDLQAVDLLKCQIDASEVERVGETLTLNSIGQALSDDDFFTRADNGNPLRMYLEVNGSADHAPHEGDSLEFNTAAVILKLGVPRVHRSLRLKVKAQEGVSTRQPHAEIDLLFNWNGRLWLVDCKDRTSEENLIAGLRRELPSTLSNDARSLLERIGNELRISQTKALKEDLLAIREMGGLLGRVVCVRKSSLPEEVAQFAHNNRIDLVRKTELHEGFRSLLYPDAPPSTNALAALQQTLSS